MTFKSKNAFNPAVLPMEYFPRLANVPDGKHTKHYLIPGKIFVAAHPFVITSIVGSGLVLCLWDSSSGIGGANHFLLPEGPEDSESATRYANVANPALLKQMFDLGASAKHMEARIFGGSLPSVTFGGGGGHLGTRNVNAATHFLHSNGIPIVQEELGGVRGRKVVFQTDDGKAWSEGL
jgi:chemotaxis protein CheD